MSEENKATQDLLIPVEGETVIAKIAGKDKEGNIEMRTVYYGNVVTTEGKAGKHKVKKGQYEQLLNDFYKSDEGKKYARLPDDIAAEKSPGSSEQLQPDDSTPVQVPDQEAELAPTKEDSATQDTEDVKSVDEKLAPTGYSAAGEPEPEPDAAKLAPMTSVSGNKNIPWVIITAIAATLAMIFSGITAYNSFGHTAVTEEELVEPVKEYEVAKVKDAITAGTVITEEMLVEETLAEDDYLALFSDKQILRADGSTVSEKPLLWANRGQAIGTYALDNMNTGTYLLNSSFSTLKEGENLVEMNIDGTVVRVPVEAVANGSSTVRLYAIVTTSDAGGNKKTYPMDLGEFKLEGKELKDIINADGKSVLEQISKDIENK